jgi:hypothetical protein
MVVGLGVADEESLWWTASTREGVVDAMAGAAIELNAARTARVWGALAH